MSWLYSIVFAGLLMSSGDAFAPANSFDHTPPVTTRNATMDEVEVFERSYPLSANGRVAISNVNGSIVVEAWDRNEVKLTTTKVADSRESLADVEIKVDARPDYFNVEADYREFNWHDRNRAGRRYNLEVQFKLSVPRTAVLNEIGTVNGSVTVSDFVNSTKISAVNGNVNATNLRGAANLSTVNGKVVADFDRLETGSRINLSTVNGGVSLTIPSDSNATVKADSLNGPITNDFGLPVRKGEYVGRDLHGRLGSGDVQIRMNSVNGPLAINRKRDGKSPSTPTNLLNIRRDSDNDDDGALVDPAQIDREVARAMREANRDAQNAAREATKEIAKLKDLKTNVDVDLKDLEVQINEGMKMKMKMKTKALADMRDAMWLGGGPSVERKSNSFAVKGTPKVVIDAKDCNVKVRGWDKPEVKYVLTELFDRPRRNGATVTEVQTASGVNLKVTADGRERGWLPDEGMGTRIEVFVPRKADLKIISDGEIRLEGVSGEIDLDGGDGAIDVRESDGKLKVSNDDGVVRVIGFRGDLVAKTAGGEVYMDGDFATIKGDAVDGKFVLTLPPGADAEINSPADRTEIEDVPEAKQASENVWRIGKGARKYTFTSLDGSLVIQGRSLIAER